MYIPQASTTLASISGYTVPISGSISSGMPGGATIGNAKPIGLTLKDYLPFMKPQTFGQGATVGNKSAMPTNVEDLYASYGSTISSLSDVPSVPGSVPYYDRSLPTSHTASPVHLTVYSSSQPASPARLPDHRPSNDVPTSVSYSTDPPLPAGYTPVVPDNRPVPKTVSSESSTLPVSHPSIPVSNQPSMRFASNIHYATSRNVPQTCPTPNSQVYVPHATTHPPVGQVQSQVPQTTYHYQNKVQPPCSGRGVACTITNAANTIQQPTSRAYTQHHPSMSTPQNYPQSAGQHQVSAGYPRQMPPNTISQSHAHLQPAPTSKMVYSAHTARPTTNQSDTTVQSHAQAYIVQENCPPQIVTQPAYPESHMQPACPTTQAHAQPAYLTTQSKTQSAYPTAQAHTQPVYPTTQAHTQHAYPTTQAQTQPVSAYPTARAQTQHAYPTTQAHTQPAYPTTQAQTQPAYPTTQAQTQPASAYSTTQQAQTQHAYPTTQAQTQHAYPTTQAQTQHAYPTTQAQTQPASAYPTAQAQTQHVYPTTQAQTQSTYNMVPITLQQGYPIAHVPTHPTYPNNQAVTPSGYVTQMSSQKINTQSGDIHTAQLAAHSRFPIAQPVNKSSAAQPNSSNKSASLSSYPPTPSQTSHSTNLNYDATNVLTETSMQTGCVVSQNAIGTHNIYGPLTSKHPYAIKPTPQTNYSAYQTVKQSTLSQNMQMNQSTDLYGQTTGQQRYPPAQTNQSGHPIGKQSSAEFPICQNVQDTQGVSNNDNAGHLQQTNIVSSGYKEQENAYIPTQHPTVRVGPLDPPPINLQSPLQPVSLSTPLNASNCNNTTPTHSISSDQVSQNITEQPPLTQVQSQRSHSLSRQCSSNCSSLDDILSIDNDPAQNGVLKPHVVTDEEKQWIKDEEVSIYICNLSYFPTLICFPPFQPVVFMNLLRSRGLFVSLKVTHIVILDFFTDLFRKWKDLKKLWKA